NEILKQEKIPEIWKTNLMWLIHKKGPTNKTENYRPITLANTINKIYTIILNKRLTTIIEKLLPDTQFGFRRNRDTIMNVNILKRIIEDAKKQRKELHA